MSDDMPDFEAPEPTPSASQDAEARATRRRWLTLAEILGVVGLLIAGLTLWNNISMRKGQEADRIAEEQRSEAASKAAARAQSLVTLDGKPEGGGNTLALTDSAGHRVQQVAITFPSALELEARTSVLEPRIESGWAAAKLLSLTDGGPDRIEGRLPVLIVSQFWEGDSERTDSAIYDLVFRTEGRMIGGRALRLRGLVLRERVSGDDARTRLDSLWQAERQRLKRAVAR